MRPHLLTLVATGSWLLASAAPALSLSLEDCQRWMAQLRTEAEGTSIAGRESKGDRKNLLDALDGARTEGRKGNSKAAVEDVKTFRERAASLAADGKVSQLQGDRLRNISDTVQHCLEQVGATGNTE
jgi:hypothetical protein